MRETASHRALISASWFATIALLSLVLWFHPLKIAGSGILLLIVLPTISAAISAGLWGGLILDPTRTITLRQSLLRGIAVAMGAFFIFALLYAIALPFAERGWSIGQSGGLFLLTATFGMLLAFPIILLGGMLGGATLYLFGRSILAKS
ncbi:MAG TPA: hypothetical protein VFR24_04680 [Candidatus Angelobacter sp.]|nr:hypothetical protein [Candidatus Angelobacter sp.]